MLTPKQKIKTRKTSPEEERGTADGIIYHISPNHRRLRAYIGAIAKGETPAEHIFCDNRNKVYLTEIEGHRYVVKRYKRPTRANQLIYTFIRMNKARRSYVYAKRLKLLGIGTPEPAAWLEQRSHGVTHTVWYISEYMPLPTLRDAYEMAGDQEKRKLEIETADFTASIHRKGVRQRDSNTSNILVDRNPGEATKFYLVDINRMNFSFPPGIYKSVLAIMQCGLDFGEKLRLVRGYASSRGFPARMCVAAAYRYMARQGARRLMRR